VLEEYPIHPVNEIESAVRRAEHPTYRFSNSPTILIILPYAKKGTSIRLKRDCGIQFKLGG